MSRDGYLPPGCTQQMCDEAAPGYWDEPEADEPPERYDGDDDFRKSYAACLRAIRERIATGGKGWEPK